MKRAIAVIGAGFGDEGKGLMVDYFARTATRPTVIRYNGGAQAGHTVVAPDGRRHVFHHYGAGTLAGANTYLSQYFIVNPTLWRREFAELPDLCRWGADTPSIFCHPAAAMTTPYDMLINQAVEMTRGDLRHGSVGVGILETTIRSEAMNGDGHISVGRMYDTKHLRGALQLIRDKWVPARLASLGVPIDSLPEHLAEALASPRTIDRYLEDVEAFSQQVHGVEFTARTLGMKPPRLPIFEGAQGLLLDAKHEFFPHVTPSRTGSPNVVALATDLGIDLLEIVYVMRAYMTRHGAGPLPFEDPQMRYRDDTNAPHDFQGTLRFAPLNLDLIAEAIHHDKLAMLPKGMNRTTSIAVTHLDQIGPDGIAIVTGGARRHCSDANDLCEAIAEKTGILVQYRASGPTAHHVRDVYFVP